jgi:hypothetical protein
VNGELCKGERTGQLALVQELHSIPPIHLRKADETSEATEVTPLPSMQSKRSQQRLHNIARTSYVNGT